MKIKFPYFRYFEEAGDDGAAGGGADDKVDTNVDTKVDTKADAEKSDNKDDQAGYWPADWREKTASGDKKIQDRLARYQSPEAVVKALVAAQNRISSGELKPTLGKNASAEELAQYRKDMGIPEAADKYDLGKDVKLPDTDKPLLDSLYKYAHETNQTPDQVKASAKAFAEYREQMIAGQAEKDLAVKTSSEDELRAEWGPEFRRNMNVFHGFLDGKMDADTKDLLLHGRLADGSPIGSSPKFLKAIVDMALENNPLATVVPIGQNQAKGMEDRINEIEKIMHDDRKTYNKDEKMQAELRELYAAREKLNERKSA